MAYQDAAHGVIEVREHDSAASPSAPDRPLRLADLMDRVLGGLGDRSCLHHDALDEHSRQVYLEILADERKEAASTFCTRANAYFAACGITVLPVLTDNGSAYRSHLFAETPARSNTNGPPLPATDQRQGRAINRSLAQEWAYAIGYTSEGERVAAFEAFLQIYNPSPRPHRTRRQSTSRPRT